MQQLEGKKAVVIGGGSGIGRGIALALADARADVVVADIEPEAAGRVADEVRQRGVRSLAVTTDATDPASLDALVDATVRELGGVQILSNNVGVVIDRPLANCTAKDWGWGVEFNFLSIVRGVAAFLPQFRKQGGEAHIVNTASLAGVLAIPSSPHIPAHLGIYTATKHAIVGFCEMLRSELAPEGIGVSVLCPGLVRSNLGMTSARNRPERFGGPLPPPPGPRAEIEGLMMSAEEAGTIVVEGIRGNRLHIFTHPEARPLIEARHRQMVEDLEFFASVKAGSGR